MQGFLLTVIASKHINVPIVFRFIDTKKYANRCATKIIFSLAFLFERIPIADSSLDLTYSYNRLLFCLKYICSRAKKWTHRMIIIRKLVCY